MSFDKVAALYVFCADYHDGQSSRLYRLLCRLDTRYRPRLPDSAWRAIRGEDDSNEWQAASSIYAQLVRDHTD